MAIICSIHIHPLGGIFEYLNRSMKNANKFKFIFDNQLKSTIFFISLNKIIKFIFRNNFRLYLFFLFIFDCFCEKRTKKFEFVLITETNVPYGSNQSSNNNKWANRWILCLMFSLCQYLDWFKDGYVYVMQWTVNIVNSNWVSHIELSLSRQCAHSLCFICSTCHFDTTEWTAVPVCVHRMKYAHRDFIKVRKCYVFLLFRWVLSNNSVLVETPFQTNQIQKDRKE